MEELKNIQKLVRALDNYSLVSVEEMASILTDIVNVLAQYRSATQEVNKDTQKQNKEMADTLNLLVKEVNKAHSDILNNVDSTTKKTIADLSKATKQQIEDAYIELDRLKEEILSSKPIDGYTPQKGVDYFTEQDIKDIASQVEVKDDTPEEIVTKLQSLKDNDRLDASAIKNLPQTVMQMRGGVSGVNKIIAGNNITISSTQENGKGEVTISSSSTLAVDEDSVAVPTAYQIGSPTEILDLNEEKNHFWSAGITEGAIITDNGDGTVNVASSTTLLRKPFATTITRSGTTATATTTGNHGYHTGDIVWIYGANQSKYNSNFSITVIGNTTFTFTVTGSPTTPATGTILSVSEDSQLYTVVVSAITNLALTDHTTNYIYADFNSGTPQYAVTTSLAGFNCLDKCLAYTIAREGTYLYIIDGRAMNVDFNRKDRRRLFETQGFQHVIGGTILSGTGTRNIAVTSGAFYYGLNKISHNDFDTSSTDVFTYAYRNNSGGWTYVASQTQIDNAYYDNGTGTLVGTGTNKYATHWVYMMNNSPSSLLVQYGQSSHSTLISAQQSSVPTAPPIVQGVGVLIGRIITRQGTNTFADVASTFLPGFIATSVPIGVFYTETPSGLVNGSNVTYTTVNTINNIINFAINGQYLHPTVDYTFTGNIITMTSALDSSLSGKGFTIVYN